MALSMQGDLRFKKSIPLLDGGVYGWGWRLCVQDGKIYYTEFNDDTENWEIRSQSLK